MTTRWTGWLLLGALLAMMVRATAAEATVVGHYTNFGMREMRG